jgi:hypothetical protein
MPVKMTFDPRQLDKIQQLLKELPIGAKSVVIPAMNEYLLGQGNFQDVGGSPYRGITHYPAFVAWPGGQKESHRTFRLMTGWKTEGADYRQKIVNRVPYAKYLHGDDTQTWRAKFGNWRTLSKLVSDNMSGALRAGISALNKWIKSKL